MQTETVQAAVSSAQEFAALPAQRRTSFPAPPWMWGQGQAALPLPSQQEVRVMTGLPALPRREVPPELTRQAAPRMQEVTLPLPCPPYAQMDLHLPPRSQPVTAGSPLPAAGFPPVTALFPFALMPLTDPWYSLTGPPYPWAALSFPPTGSSLPLPQGPPATPHIPPAGCFPAAFRVQSYCRRLPGKGTAAPSRAPS